MNITESQPKILHRLERDFQRIPAAADKNWSGKRPRMEQLHRNDSTIRHAAMSYKRKRITVKIGSNVLARPDVR